MKTIIPVLAVLFCITACEPNTPNYKKHQPDDPATWSPVGKTYISTDSSLYGRYYGAIIEFRSDSVMFRTLFYERETKYRLDYPDIWLDGWTTAPWYVFLDTLTVSKAREPIDDSSCYLLSQ